MKRTSLKVLISVLVITLMIPFSIIKTYAFDYTIYATVSSSRITYEDDPTDSRYQIATQFIAIDFSEECVGYLTIQLGTDNNYASGAVTDPTVFGLNGARTDYLGIYNTSPSIYGYQFKISWEGLNECLLMFQYKVLKTVNTGTHGPIEIELVATTNSNMAPTQNAQIPAQLELLILNENLSDQEIEGYLQQINQNYLPAILTLLQSINQNIQNNGNSNSTISARFTNHFTLTAKETWYYPTGYTVQEQIGTDFSITNNGIVCNRDGYVLLIGKVYFNSGSSTGIRVGMEIRKNSSAVSNSYSYSWCVNAVTVPTVALTEVHEGDVLRLGVVRNGNITCIAENSSNLLVQYIGSSDNQELSGIISALNIIQSNQTQMITQNSNAVQQILEALSQIQTTVEQQENIDLIYQDITTYNETINNITNRYNLDITNNFDQLEFNDLLDVDPESQTNILESVNLYNSIFNGLINIPDVKAILIFLLLCILIIAMVG